jgi:hypothetical protein
VYERERAMKTSLGGRHFDFGQAEKLGVHWGGKGVLTDDPIYLVRAAPLPNFKHKAGLCWQGSGYSSCLQTACSQAGFENRPHGLEKSKHREFWDSQPVFRWEIDY